MENPRENEKGRKLKKGKDHGPHCQGARIWPSKSIASWQTIAEKLERGQPPIAAAAICDSQERILELQALAAAHQITSDVVLISKYDENAVEVEGAIVTLLPFAGNIAMVQACVAKLDGSKPNLVDSKPPAKVEVKVDQSIETTGTIRVTIPLCFQEKENHSKFYVAPEYALKLAGIKAKEVKTYGWTNEKSVISGYATFNVKDIPQILLLSGVSGIFFTQLAQDVIAQPPVQWIPPIDAETAIQYLHRVQEAGKEKDVALAFRRGGGTYLGVLAADNVPKNRAWSAFGIPPSWGPKTLQDWLESQGWRLGSTPTPPKGRNKPWNIQAMSKTNFMM